MARSREAAQVWRIERVELIQSRVAPRIERDGEVKAAEGVDHLQRT